MNKVLLRIAEELFYMAKGLGQAMGEIVFTPYGQLRLTNIPRMTYYNRLQKYERHGLLKKIRTKQGNTYVLSEMGKRLRRKATVKQDRNDGFSTIIMFDIPEEKHKSRDNFRRYLIKNGYTQIQKSVFVSPFKIFEDMKLFAKELKIEKNIMVMAGKIEQFVKPD
jgi:CRISPR-associated endonuclease Cas2